MKNTRPKILYVITKGNWGGAQRYVFDLATSLSDTFDVAVVYGSGTTLAENLEEAGIRTIKIDSLKRDINPLLDFKSLIELVEIFKKEKPDIVHLNTSKIGGIGAVAARLTGVPKIIFTSHGWAWNEDRAFLSKTLIVISHWLTVLLCHKVIAVCYEIKKQINRLPLVSDKKIVVVPNGISPITFEEKAAARIKIGPGSEKIWIGTIAELHHNKGLDILIDAFAATNHESHNAALYIIGEGEERARLQKQIDSLDLTHRIHLVGFITDAQNLLKAFDVFALPSRTEAFPYVLLEAGLAQLPIVASNVGGIPELIKHLKTGILTKRGDRNELASILELLVTDSALVAEIGHGLRKEVENNYSKEVMVEKTLSVYNSK